MFANLDKLIEPARIIALLFTIISHELAHGYIALANGDNTAKNAGRLSLNPFIHLDPVGTLTMVFFQFGWAKPVPINPMKFRNRKSGMLTVSLAGVSVNVIFAALSIYLLSILPHDQIFLRTLLFNIAIYGVAFALFNLLPIPPLDGSKVVMTFLPFKWTMWIYRHEYIFYFFLMFLVASGLINDFLSPLIIRMLNGMIQVFSVG